MTIDISLNDKAKLPTHGIVLLTGKEEKNRDSWLKSKFNYENCVISKESKLVNQLSVKDNISFPYHIEKEKISKVINLLSFNGVKDFKITRLSKLNKLKLLIGKEIARDSNVIVIKDLAELIPLENYKEFTDFITEISKDRLIIISTDKPEIIAAFNECAINNVSNSKFENLKFSNQKLRVNCLYSLKTFFYNYISMLVSIILLAISFVGLWKMADDLSYNPNDEVFKQIKQQDISNIQVSTAYYNTLLDDEEFDSIVKDNNLYGTKTLEYGVSIHPDFPSGISNKLTHFTNLAVGAYDKEFCSQFELIAGDYPSDENDVLLTDIQLTLFEMFGYVNPLTKEVIPSADVTADKLLELPIDFKEPNFCYKICGFVKSDVDLSEYQKFFQDYLNDSEVNHSFVEGIDNICFISNTRFDQIKKRFKNAISKDFRSFKVEDVEAFISRVSYFVPDDVENDVLFFNDGKKELADEETIIPLDTYLMNSEELYLKNNQYVLDKKYVFSGEDKSYFTSGYNFFVNSLKQAAVDYVCEEHYADAFNNISSTLKSYAYLYFNGQIPDVISVEDQKKIFSDYLYSAYSLEQMEHEYLSEVISLYRTMVRDYISRYLSNTIDKTATIQLADETRKFKVVGFTIGVKRYFSSVTFTEKVAEEFCGPRYDGKYGSFLIKTDDSTDFKKCLEIINSDKQKPGINDYKFLNVNVDEIKRIQSDINSRLPGLVSLIVIIFSLGIITLFVYYKKNILLLNIDKSTKTISYVNTAIVLLLSLIIGSIGIVTFVLI